jgi:L-arabinonolactonase
MHIERVGNIRLDLGEGPVWDTLEQALYCVDTLAGRILRYDPKSDAFASWKTPGLIGSMALRAQSGAVVALNNGFHWFDFQTGNATFIVDPQEPGAPTQFNDGKADSHGRFIAGTVHKSMTAPLGAIYCLEPDGRATQLDSGIIVSNGPCWSPDSSVFYFADSIRKLIYAYDYDVDRGRVANRRIFADTASLGGIPDGATVDAEGRLWTALCNAGKVVCYGVDGQVEQVIETPPKLVSSVMFGGARLDQLFCTSINPASMPPEFGCDPDGCGGELYVITDLGVAGLPEPRFAG